MNKKTLISIVVLIFLVIGGFSYYLLNQNNVEYINFKKVSNEDAKQALINGDIDIYAGSLSSADIEELSTNPDITLFPATSTVFGLYLNPYPSTETFNPFSIQEVRYALQFLVNREQIVNDVFPNFADPMVTVPWIEHPAYAGIKETVDSLGINYNKEKASALIKEGMEGAGAIYEDGLWKYQGKAVDVIISSYEKGSTKNIADLVGASLEEEGFNVIYNITGEDDISPENYTDAAELKWNVAISGWIYYNQSKDIDVAILRPYVSNGWWEYTNEEINNLEESRRDSKTEEEREAINNELVQKYIEDSTCVWLLSRESVSAARSEVKGLIQDKFIGITNYTNIREAYIPMKDTLVVGLPEAYVAGEGWNNLVINGIDMMYIVNTVHDPTKWNVTNTLESEGFRWPFVIEGNIADSVIEVPEDAFIWDTNLNKWTAVGDNKEAVTKVIYDLSKYVGTNWHDGEEITWADVVYNIARVWECAYDEEKKEIVDIWSDDVFDSIIGIKIYGEKLEVYLNNWSSDTDDLLNIAGVFQRVAPWEIYSATDNLVFDQRLYDYDLVSGSDREILDLANPMHISNIFKELYSFNFTDIESMMTMGNIIYANESDLSARIETLKKWYDSHNHIYINDGPFYVDSFNATDGSINLRSFQQDKKYPFDKGYWRR